MERSLRLIVAFALSLGTFSSTNLAAPGAEFATTREGIVGTYRRAVPDDDEKQSLVAYMRQL